MEFKRRENVEGNFAKKGEDIKQGDVIEIADEGKIIEGQFGEQNVFKIKTAAGEFLLSVNNTSINAMIDEWGVESAGWVGKRVMVHTMKQNVAGKFLNVYYIAPEGFEMGEYGFEKTNVNGQGFQDAPETGGHTEAPIPEFQG